MHNAVIYRLSQSVGGTVDALRGILYNLKYNPAVRSNILSKLIFASCIYIIRYSSNTLRFPFMLYRTAVSTLHVFALPEPEKRDSIDTTRTTGAPNQQELPFVAPGTRSLLAYPTMNASLFFMSPKTGPESAVFSKFSRNSSCVLVAVFTSYFASTAERS